MKKINDKTYEEIAKQFDVAYDILYENDVVEDILYKNGYVEKLEKFLKSVDGIGFLSDFYKETGYMITSDREYIVLAIVLGL